MLSEQGDSDDTAVSRLGPIACRRRRDHRGRADPPDFVQEFRASLAAACERGAFRVVHYSLQRDHVHMIVEANGKDALGSGMKSICARLARVAQRVFGWKGPVLDGRYHLGC